MANTTYVDNSTIITADTMNDLNRLHYTILSDPADAAAVRTAISAVGTTGFTSTGDIIMSAASIIEAEGAAVASAATTEIWATDGDTRHITGTTTITSLGTATQAGQWQKIIFDGILTLTHGANINLPGSANITTAADDFAWVYADTTTQHDVLYFPKSGRAVVAATDGLGYNQTWQNVTASRVLSTNYTNSTGRPIYISYWHTSVTNTSVTAVVDGVTVSFVNYNDVGQGSQIPMAFIVPNGGAYSIASTTVIGTWVELR